MKYWLIAALAGAGGLAAFLLPAVTGTPFPSAPASAPCALWGAAVGVGALDRNIINEASGLEISARFPDRLYHVNDSGDRGRFYVTDRSGGGTQRVRVEDFAPIDAEDLTLGACGSGDGTCLFIGDIGDNDRVRPFLEIVVIEEQEVFPDRVEPVHRFRFRYSGRAEDAESLAIHPNGDLYILTKTADYGRLFVQPSNVYRLRRDAWANAGGEVLTAELAGQIDFTAISTDFFSGSLPTAADISDDGRRLLVLTYNDAFEFFLDLSAGEWKPASEMAAGVDYRALDIEMLEQQEAIAWEPAGDAFLYETEFIATAQSAGRARIMRVACQE